MVEVHDFQTQPAWAPYFNPSLCRRCAGAGLAMIRSFNDQALHPMVAPRGAIMVFWFDPANQPGRSIYILAKTLHSTITW
jgi:hypothetical protein